MSASHHVGVRFSATPAPFRATFLQVWLFPRRRFSIESSLTPAEVMERIDGAVAPETDGWFSRSRSDRPFKGWTVGQEFELTRVIHYRNSFLPTISGTVEAASRGSRVSGTMSIHPAVLVFMAVWITFVGAATVGLVRQSFASGDLSPALLVPFGMLAFGLALPLIGFIPEARRATRILTELVSGTNPRLD